MAVKKSTKANDNGVQLVSGDLETKLKSNLKNTPKKVEKEDIEGVSIEMPEQPKVAPMKMVKVLMADNHKCCIGGEWYYLLKDKHYNVPENVKEILLRANKLRPL